MHAQAIGYEALTKMLPLDAQVVVMSPDDHYSNAILGIVAGEQGLQVLYCREKVLSILENADSMDPEEAEEFFEFNIAGAYVQNGPVFLVRPAIDEALTDPEEQDAAMLAELLVYNELFVEDGEKPMGLLDPLFTSAICGISGGLCAGATAVIYAEDECLRLIQHHALVRGEVTPEQVLAQFQAQVASETIPPVMLKTSAGSLI